MKKILLFSLFFLFSAIIVLAYETIIFHFPDGELWEKAYYKKRMGEAILQYVPGGQISTNWKRTIIVHSYNYAEYSINVFSQNEIKKMMKINPTGKYKTLRRNDNDAVFTRCTEDYKTIQAQCEFLRIAKAHEGIVTIQYINRNKKDFENNYTLWLQVIRGAKLMNSYYRNERTFNKSIYFEL